MDKIRSVLNRKAFMADFYGPKLRMSKSLAKSFTLGLILVIPFYAGAVDRISYVSVSTVFPYGLKPDNAPADITQSIQGAIFFENTFAMVFGWDLGLTGSNRMAFTSGIQWYLNDSNFLDPYIAEKFLFKLNDKNDLGFRSTVGVEWNARPISNMDNLRFFVESGVSFVFSTPRQLWFELAHVGASWHF